MSRTRRSRRRRRGSPPRAPQVLASAAPVRVRFLSTAWEQRCCDRLAAFISRRRTRWLGAVFAGALVALVCVGLKYGFFGMDVRIPGNAARTEDASGSWYRYVMPGLEARNVTRRRLLWVKHALACHALENGGVYPEQLDDLVELGVLTKEKLRDGWEHPFIYERQAEGTDYQLYSRGENLHDATDDLLPEGEARL